MLRIAGLILAAGLSRRMGETKALLKLSGQTLAERQIKCLLDAGVRRVFMVTGHDAQNVEAAVQAYPVSTVYNPEYKDGMFSSVKAGLAAVKQGGFEAVFLLPVDCVLISPQTLRPLITRYEKGGAKIVYPCCGGKRGHPPLFNTRLIDDIIAYEGEGGLKAALSAFDSYSVCVESASGCLADIDTKEDYLNALKLLGLCAP